MPTDTTIIDRLRALTEQEHCGCGMCAYCLYAPLLRESADALTAAHAARDAWNPWRSAALLVGESLATDGPVGYYSFTPDQWRAWALDRLTTALRQRDEALTRLGQEQIQRRSEVATLTRERDEARALHQELMFQVGSKFPGETRHETAKRYIREREDLGRLPPFGSSSATD